MPTSLHHSQNEVGAAKQRSRDRADDVQHAGIAEPSLVPSSSSTSTTYRAILQQIAKQSRAVASSQGATSIRFSTHVTPARTMRPVLLLAWLQMKVRPPSRPTSIPVARCP